MDYTFELIGVTPILAFLNHHPPVAVPSRATYLGSHCCTLDAFIASVEHIPLHHHWQLDRVVDSIIQFWLHNAEPVQHWKQRLATAGAENLLVARVADVAALRTEFELLLGQD